jgi:hypothetical protein
MKVCCLITSNVKSNEQKMEPCWLTANSMNISQIKWKLVGFCHGVWRPININKASFKAGAEIPIVLSFQTLWGSAIAEWTFHQVSRMNEQAGEWVV